MKLKQLLLLTGICLQSDVFAQHMWQLGNGTNVHWYYMDGDEFAGTVLDTSKWRNSYPWGRSLYCSNDPHYYTDGANLIFKDGVVSLEARKESLTAKAVPYENEDAELLCNGKPMGKKNLMNFSYTAGMFFSNKQYKYGFYEIRFRADEGKGLWPAFWLYAGKDNYEIDIFEIVGSRNQDFHVDMHCPSGCKNYKTTLGLVKKNWGDYVGSSENWKDGYNVIAAEWQPGYVKWYLNGQPAAYWKGNFDNPMWVIADIAISKDGGAFGPGPDATTVFPARFDIDYVRMWSTSPQQSPVATFQGANDPLVRRSTAAVSGNARVTKKTKPEYNRKALKSEQVFISLAVSAGGKWMLNVTGRPSDDFQVKVTRKNGEVVYQSSDRSLQEHYFGAIVAGEKHTLTMVNGGEQVVYDF